MGTREAAQHSQSLEAWFMHAPGIKVVVPSSPHDAKGLLKASIRDDSPVVFMEHRLLYNDRQEVPEGTWISPLGKASVLQRGTDLTIVSYGYALKKVKDAVQRFGHDGAVEIIDLRTIVPLDIESVIESVKKTGRLLIVHEAPRKCGVGAEIVREVVQKAFDYLDAEPLVYGGLDVPMPFSGSLEDECMIRSDAILEKMEYLLTGIY
jgi:pyruvate dehydrogenase E1 component beta subunit